MEKRMESTSEGVGFRAFGSGFNARIQGWRLNLSDFRIFGVLGLKVKRNGGSTISTSRSPSEGISMTRWFKLL